MITGTANLGANFVNHGVVLTASAVKVRSATKVGTTVVVTIDGYTGHTYQLQRSASLNTGSFANIGPPQIGTTGAMLTFTDGNASGAEGFYRVVVNP